METFVEKEVNEKVEVLEEEYKEKVESLTESLDGYLDTVVEDFVEKNAPMYEAQIAEEKTKTLLEMFDSMLTVVGADMLTIQEAKDTRDEDADLSIQLTESEDKISDIAEKLVESKREADKFLKLGIISELSEGLTILEKTKFEKLAEIAPFDRTPSYVEKLETIKEQILSSRAEDFNEAPAALPDTAFKQPEKVSSKDALDYTKYL